MLIKILFCHLEINISPVISHKFFIYGISSFKNINHQIPFLKESSALKNTANLQNVSLDL